MVLIFPDGIFWGDESKPSEARLKDIKLSQKQTSLYNSRNEILRSLAQKLNLLVMTTLEIVPKPRNDLKKSPINIMNKLEKSINNVSIKMEKLWRL